MTGDPTAEPVDPWPNLTLVRMGDVTSGVAFGMLRRTRRIVVPESVLLVEVLERDPEGEPTQVRILV